MAEIKYLDLTGLQRYDQKIKEVVNTGLDAKADKAEVDQKIGKDDVMLDVNESIVSETSLDRSNPNFNISGDNWTCLVSEDGAMAYIDIDLSYEDGELIYKFNSSKHPTYSVTLTYIKNDESSETDQIKFYYYDFNAGDYSEFYTNVTRNKNIVLTTNTDAQGTRIKLQTANNIQKNTQDSIEYLNETKVNNSVFTKQIDELNQKLSNNINNINININQLCNEKLSKEHDYVSYVVDDITNTVVGDYQMLQHVDLGYNDWMVNVSSDEVLKGLYISYNRGNNIISFGDNHPMHNCKNAIIKYKNNQIIFDIIDDEGKIYTDIYDASIEDPDCYLYFDNRLEGEATVQVYQASGKNVSQSFEYFKKDKLSKDDKVLDVETYFEINKTLSPNSIENIFADNEWKVEVSGDFSLKNNISLQNFNVDNSIYVKNENAKKVIFIYKNGQIITQEFDENDQICGEYIKEPVLESGYYLSHSGAEEGICTVQLYLPYTSSKNIYEALEYLNESKADKAEVDLKADKAEVESSLALKADKTEVESSLALKADKTEVDQKIGKDDVMLEDTNALTEENIILTPENPSIVLSGDKWLCKSIEINGDYVQFEASTSNGVVWSNAGKRINSFYMELGADEVASGTAVVKYYDLDVDDVVVEFFNCTNAFGIADVTLRMVEPNKVVMYVKSQQQKDLNTSESLKYLKETLSTKITAEDLPTAVSQLSNDAGYAVAGDLKIAEVTEGLGENVAKAYKFEGGAESAVIEIPKDQTLKSVELGKIVDDAFVVDPTGEILRFTYIIADGSEKVVDVNVSNLITEAELDPVYDLIDTKLNAADVLTVSNDEIDAMFA